MNTGHAGKETENKYDFKREQKTGTVVADVTSVGRLFHKGLPATRKPRSPTVTVLSHLSPCLRYNSIHTIVNQTGIWNMLRKLGSMVCTFPELSISIKFHITPEFQTTARIILRKRKFDHITTDVRDRLHWLPVQQRIKYKVCVLVYKSLHQAALAYLAELCSSVSESANRGQLRSAVRGDLAVPRSRTTRYAQRCFAVSGPTLWNSLPLSVRDPSLSLTQFCVRLKTVLFCRAYGTPA